MNTAKFIIIEIGSDAYQQVDAARMAIKDGIQAGDTWGIRLDGTSFSVRRNKQSIRVYPHSKDGRP